MTSDTYSPPGLGSWALDASHCERPMSRFTATSFPGLYTRGMRAGMERYGILLDTIELALVDGFSYTAVRPLGAPPGAKGAPPKLLLKLLLRVHPGLRRRVRRAGEVVAEKPWREDTRVFFDEYAPQLRAKLRDLQAVDVTTLEAAGLVAHVEELVRVMEGDLFEHFHHAAACMLPVGDFIVHVRDWTGCTTDETIALLTGHSPNSVDAVEALDAVVDALRTAPDCLTLLDEPGADAGSVLAKLRTAPETVGAATTTWLDLVEQRVVTGHQVAEKRAVEMPELLVDSLRARLSAPSPSAAIAAAEQRAAELRARVPESERALFDELLVDARLVYPLRDGQSVFGFWYLGLCRRALLEAGSRLVITGALDDAEHAVDLEPGEVVALLRGEGGPSAAAVAARFAGRQGRTCAEMPDILGPAPAPPPPPEWLPAPAARLARAMGVYLDAMFTEGTRATGTEEVSGIAASPGCYRGPARLVRSPADLADIRKGDVLVARLTSPAYNVVLPLVGAIVTERGGLLSHPAIVSREFGIPGVVGARGALDMIPSDAPVEVDGDAGVVRLLS